MAFFIIGTEKFYIFIGMKKLLVIFCCLSLFSLSPAQDIIKGDITGRVDSLIKLMPSTRSTNEYHPLNNEQQKDWAKVVRRIIEGNIQAANSKAEKIGYRVITFLDLASQQTYYFLEKHPDSLNYWGTVVFNPEPLRSRLVIQVPHPLADSLTGVQGFQMFKNTGAYVFCISGTHRCNSSDSTDCSGRTTTCSQNSVNFRKSDQAHSIESMFQVTTEVLLENNPEMIFIQPHGFTQGPGDPDFVMSNGTRFTPDMDYLTAFKDTLLKAVPFLKFIIIHIDPGWAQLAALTNVQGRLINGSSSPCYLNAPSATGRFLHIEQAPAMRKPAVVVPVE